MLFHYFCRMRECESYQVGTPVRVDLEKRGVEVVKHKSHVTSRASARGTRVRERACVSKCLELQPLEGVSV